MFKYKLKAQYPYPNLNLTSEKHPPVKKEGAFFRNEHSSFIPESRPISILHSIKK